ncbi:MAG TPA: hypothetical protein VFA65_08385 [Bryobacteraceae bacterium]|nr:hypothetical protein [Bryobacteraceae bacterium]
MNHRSPKVVRSEYDQIADFFVDPISAAFFMEEAPQTLLIDIGLDIPRIESGARVLKTACEGPKRILGLAASSRGVLLPQTAE